MFEVKDGTKTIYFTRQADADNYNNYLQNGLKVIRTDNRTYHFNNGDRLIDVSMQGEQKKRYVLHSGHRTITEVEKMKRITIKQAKEILLADNTYRKDVYLVQNSTTKVKYYTTGKIGSYSVCRVDRSQCNPNELGAEGFKFAYVGK